MQEPSVEKRVEGSGRCLI